MNGIQPENKFIVLNHKKINDTIENEIYSNKYCSGTFDKCEKNEAHRLSAA